MKNLFLSLWIISTISLASDLSPQTIREISSNLHTNLPDLVIDKIQATPWVGVYEVDSGRKVFYVDAGGKYALIGNLLDLSTKQSLTEARSTELNKINWASLPLDAAILRVIGKGSNRIAIFTDPDCPFCTRLEMETIPQLNNVKIYYFLYPLPIHPNAASHARQILCSENPESAIYALMVKEATLNRYEKCNNANKLTLMESVAANVVEVSATPTIILPNGKLITGLVPADYLNQLISQNLAESNVN